MVSFKKHNELSIENFHTVLRDNFRNSNLDLNIDINVLQNVLDYIITTHSITTFTIQRKFAIGYAHAAKIIDILEEYDIIGISRGSKPRNVNVKSYDDILNKIDQHHSKICYTQENHQELYTLELDNVSNGIEFELFCSKLLMKNDFSNVKVTQASNDYGIDILAEKDSVKYAIQCKFYSAPVGNSAIQEAYTGRNYYDCHVAVVMTNSTFTKNAIELAKLNKVILWDKTQLQEFIKNSK